MKARVLLVILFSLITFSFAANSQKIISLAPNLTEIICWLGGEGRLAAVTTDCDYPPSVRHKPKVGRYTYPDLEKIVALQPAVVVLEDTADRRFLAKLAKLKIAYSSYNFQTLSVFFQELRRLNAELGLSGEKKIIKLEKIFNKNRVIVRQPNQKILILLWQDPYIAAGQGTFLSDYFYWRGYTNIIRQSKYPKVSEELLLTKEIPIIINLSGRPLRNGIKAKVIDTLDPNIMLRLSPRLIEYYEKISI